MADTTVLVTVTGPDRPGVTSVLLAAMSRHRVSLLDVEQVVIRGRLTLGVLVTCPNDAEALQDELEEAMNTVGMHVDVEVDAAIGRQPMSTHAVVILGSPVTARAFSAVSRQLAALGANIDTIRGIADYPVTGMELMVTAIDSGPDTDSRLRTALAEVAVAEQVDVAVERAGLARRGGPAPPRHPRGGPGAAPRRARVPRPRSRRRPGAARGRRTPSARTIR
ncbi:ACT domain-containing protein, partial [Nocardia abscessus]|uniref:ACT domain-containing protein n=1 Tax=Nocardia abscessus TaxID=120957 RepID=UPI00245602A7